MRIPFATSTYTRSVGLQPPARLLNCFAEADQSQNTDSENTSATIVIQRPGLTPFHTFIGDNIRGLYRSESVSDGHYYAVHGSSVSTFDGTTATLIGTVTDDGKSAAFAPAFDKLVIASGGHVYTYDYTTNTFAIVAMPDDRVVVDIAELDNYVILACPDGRFYWMQPGELTVDALNFATAESSADGLVAVAKAGDELYFFGSSSTEVWAATGDITDTTNAFAREPGRNFTRGNLDRDTVQIVDNTLFWVGNTGIAYRAGTIPQRISTPAIEEAIRLRTGSLSALTVIIDSHEFYVLKVPGRGSYAYDASTKMWCEFGTYGETTWRPNFAVGTLDGGYLLSGLTSGVVWTFDPLSFVDDDLPMERLMTATIHLPQKPIRNDSFSIDVGCSTACDFRLRWHDAGESFPDSYEIMPATIQNDRLTLYRLGMAHTQYRTFEFSTLADAQIRFGDAHVNDADDRQKGV